MKLKYAGQESSSTQAFTANCVDCCQRVLLQLGRIKDSILADARNTLRAHEHLIQLALNEAEALAWQTEYPHLFFPALATEKIQSVASWNNRQQSIRPQ